MKCIFLANFIVDEKEGIYKKIYAEAKALLSLYDDCYLILKTTKGCKVITVSDGNEKLFPDTVLHKSQKIIKNDYVGLMYVRAMIPSPTLIGTLRLASKKGVRIIYEIPTYPYFMEMYKTARKKHRAIVKILLDLLFNPLIFHYAERILIVRSNKKKKINRKMVEISNGVDSNQLAEKVYNDRNGISELNLVAVGTIYPYHGYDRLIEGMRLCEEEVNKTRIKLHLIGSSATMDELKKLAEKYNLKNVFFYGQKSTLELNEMYKNFDIGIGCIGLHRKNADIDTSLKVIEYYCRGIPVVSSAECPEKDFTLKISADDSPVNMDQILDFFNSIDFAALKDFSDRARKKYSWDGIISGALNKSITND